MGVFMADYTKQFINKLNDINNLAKGRGFRNGLDMAQAAYEQKILTYSEFCDYKNAHNMRNSGSHGFMEDLSITSSTYNFVNNIFRKLDASSLRGTGSPNRRPNHSGGSSNNRRKENNKPQESYQDYYKKMMPGGSNHVEWPKPPSLEDGKTDDLDHVIRFDNNTIKITVDHLSKKVGGYELTLTIESSYEQNIEITATASEKYDPYKIQTWIFNIAKNTKKRIIVNLKGIGIKNAHFSVNSSYSFVYSLKDNRIIS